MYAVSACSSNKPAVDEDGFAPVKEEKVVKEEKTAAAAAGKRKIPEMEPESAAAAAAAAPAKKSTTSSSARPKTPPTFPPPKDVHECLGGCCNFQEYFRMLHRDPKLAWHAEYCRETWGKADELVAAVNGLPDEEIE